LNITTAFLFGLKGEERRLPFYIAIVRRKTDETLVRDAFPPKLEEVAPFVENAQVYHLS